ncbi:lytic transglycosylase domain-containing protein [Ensifer sp. ENS12]|uniref:lytic transglycosylase domain-containing protein n=1 Tax=Ensifer sp. ENS12 TaxID=2854774 RepID=UPI001C477238|nr:lytic transglycosylase domain-containing protein [Ensifer sp. ENS12]MBV7518887.1 lytic transglycosylase domain-containing protein [Ensifer sp. ENS12]
MEKRARKVGISGQATFVAAALVSLVWGGISQATDVHENAITDANTIAWSNQKERALASNFEERWSGSEREFVLGADGVAKHAAGTRKNLQNFGDSNQIDADMSREEPEIDTSPDVEITRVPTGNLNQIGATQQRSNEVKSCGPSPLSADEIRSLVVQAARKYSVDEVFATAIAWTESGFDQSRNSSKGARGPMQLMPATAARFGVKDVCDPAQNIEGGMKYLRVLLDEFQNPLLVAAAYNSGEQRIYEHGGIPPFQETVGYVAKVVNYQLGLPTPAARSKSRKAAEQAASDARDSGDAGVIAVKKTGAFVGGVMHF